MLGFQEKSLLTFSLAPNFIGHILYWDLMDTQVLVDFQTFFFA